MLEHRKCITIRKEDTRVQVSQINKTHADRTALQSSLAMFPCHSRQNIYDGRDQCGRPKQSQICVINRSLFTQTCLKFFHYQVTNFKCESQYLKIVVFCTNEHDSFKYVHVQQNMFHLVVFTFVQFHLNGAILNLVLFLRFGINKPVSP